MRSHQGFSQASGNPGVARPEQFHLEGAVWVKPAEATKTAKPPPGTAVAPGAGGAGRRAEGEPGRAGIPGHAPRGDDGQRGDDASAAQRRDRGVVPRVPNELQGLGARARRGRAAFGVRADARGGLGGPSPPTSETTRSRSAARSCRRGPTASRGRGGFRTGHGPLNYSCVRRLPTMRRSSRWSGLPHRPGGVEPLGHRPTGGSTRRSTGLRSRGQVRRVCL